jgi:hypothetical protein
MGETLFSLSLVGLLVLNGWRLSDVLHEVRHLRHQLDFMTFILSGLAQGKSPQEFDQMIDRIKTKADETLAFVQIAEAVRKPWWRGGWRK